MWRDTLGSESGAPEEIDLDAHLRGLLVFWEVGRLAYNAALVSGLVLLFRSVPASLTAQILLANLVVVNLGYTLGPAAELYCLGWLGYRSRSLRVGLFGGAVLLLLGYIAMMFLAWAFAD